MSDTKALIEKAHAGDKEARDRLIEENVGLIYSIIRRFFGRGYDAEDLFQIGSIGLIKAVDKFDLTFDVQFSTYAVPMIQGEIKRFLRDDGMVKVSRTLKENAWKAKQAEDRLLQRLGREPTLKEISEETGIEAEDIVMAMDANIEVESIYKTVYQSDGNEIYLVDKVSVNSSTSKDNVSASTDIEKEELINRLLLEKLIADLDELEQNLIKMRYYQNKTQSEVARRLGISQVQVSRLEKKILMRMREKCIV